MLVQQIFSYFAPFWKNSEARESGTCSQREAVLPLGPHPSAASLHLGSLPVRRKISIWAGFNRSSRLWKSDPIPRIPRSSPGSSVFGRKRTKIEFYTPEAWHGTAKVAISNFEKKKKYQNPAGWWFEPLWKILVNWDDYSQYMGK